MTVALGTLPELPAIVEGTVGHTRRTPLRHTFRNRIYQWLVDLDDLPRMPRWLRPFSTFSAADHLGDPHRSIRHNVDAFCALHGVDLSGGRVLMLANARVLGHTFDPLSVFWCLDSGGDLACIVAEVHNTYGERHAYFLQPDATGCSRTDKAFYVSPFFTVDGSYDLQFTLGSSSVSSSIVLRQGGVAVFGATFDGTPQRARSRRLVRLILTQPLMTHRVSLLIRIHGVWLWMRRLPVVSRRPHEPQKGVS